MYTYIVIDDESLIRKGTIKKLQPMEEQISCIVKPITERQALN